VLGITEDYAEYQRLADKVKKAFQQKYYNKETGTYGPYGGNIFALVMGVPSEQLDRVISALKADILANEGHLDTGIFGTQFFLKCCSVRFK
jgi:alpha-L-rhamnosidase